MGKKLSKWEYKRRARTLFNVLVDTGRLNLKEAHKRHYGDRQTDYSHEVNAGRDMLKPEVWAEFIKILQASEQDVKELDGSKVIQGMIKDLNLIDTYLQDPELEPEQVSKLINTKTSKEKLLGSYLGIWNAEKENKKEETDPDKLFEQGRGLFGDN